MENLLAATLLSGTTLSATASEHSNGKVTMVVSLEVENYAEWKTMFDAGAPVREKANIKVLQILSVPENSKNVLVVEEAPSMKAAKDFIEVLKERAKPGASNLEIKLYAQHDL